MEQTTLRKIRKLVGPITEHPFEIQWAIELMHAHFGEKLSVPDLAKKVNCSESHFTRLFKQER